MWYGLGKVAPGSLRSARPRAPGFGTEERARAFAIPNRQSLTEQHPFAGRKGSAARDRFAADLYVEQSGCCRMCKAKIPASLRGRSGKSAAVVDHLRPWRLRPDLAFSQSNLQLVCRACHATCHSIEAAHAGDAELIAQAKERAGQSW